MAYHNILSKNDRALVAYLVSRSAGTTADVWPAKRSQEKTLPNTVCYSEEATSDGGGNFRIKAAVMVRSNPFDEMGETEQTARLAAETRAATAGDALMYCVEESSAALAALITTAARAKAVSDATNNADLGEYTCLSCDLTGQEASFDEGGAWVDTFNLEMVACPSALA